MRILIYAVLILLCAGMAYAQTGQDGLKLQEGQLVDAYGNRLGVLKPDCDRTRILDNYGNLQGFIGKDGTIIDRYGNRKGQIKKP